MLNKTKENTATFYSSIQHRELSKSLVRALYFQFSKMTRFILHTLMLITVTLVFIFASSNLVNAQQSSAQTSRIGSDDESLPEVQLLQKAKSLRHDNQQQSLQLAMEALQLSESNNNKIMKAQSHTLLGKVNNESKNTEQAIHHFRQATLIYKELDDKRNQIQSSLDYISLLVDNKMYPQLYSVTDYILPIAIEHADQLQIARILTAKGDALYKQKRYDQAIIQYKHTVKYFTADDKKTLRQLGEAYKKIAQASKRNKKLEQTSEYYQKALEVYTALGQKHLMARTLHTLAEAERYLGNLVIALDYSIQGLEIHKEIDEPLRRAKALVGAGIIYRNIGRYEKSLEHLHDAHLYYKEVNDINGIATTSNQIGLIYSRLRQFDLARSFFQLTRTLPEQDLERTTLASALREMAVIDLDAGDYESAKVMAQKARNIYVEENDKTKESITARIMGNIFRAQKDRTNAIKYYRESLVLSTKVGNKPYQIKALTALAGELVGHDDDEAVKLLNKSLSLSNSINSKSGILYAYRALHKAEKSRNNYEDSLYYAEEEISLQAEIQKEKDDQKLNRVKASLHSYKLEVELASLREKARLDQLELSKKNNEIEIAEQANTIHELELIKNKYATVALASLLIICLVLVFFIYRRFADSKKRNKELNYLASRDPLTNCYNRRSLFNFIEQDFKNPSQLKEYCIIMADIDHFKEVNDTYGHGIGDAVLVGVANIMQGCVRQNDVAARFGGEEFCILLRQVSQQQAKRIAETMRNKIEKGRFDNISVTCSFGITSTEINAEVPSPSDLIHQADLALYRSKSLGRNQVTVWDESIKENKA